MFPGTSYFEFSAFLYTLLRLAKSNLNSYFYIDQPHTHTAQHTLRMVVGGGVLHHGLKKELEKNVIWSYKSIYSMCAREIEKSP